MTSKGIFWFLSVGWPSQCRQLSAIAPLIKSVVLLTLLPSSCATFPPATTLLSCFDAISPQATMCKFLRFIKSHTWHMKLCTRFGEAGTSQPHQGCIDKEALAEVADLRLCTHSTREES